MPLNWIPIDKRLPKAEVVVLVTDGTYVAEGKYTFLEEEGIWETYTFFDKEITHWAYFNLPSTSPQPCQNKNATTPPNTSAE